jgi:hypothetical protein
VRSTAAGGGGGFATGAEVLAFFAKNDEIFGCFRFAPGDGLDMVAELQPGPPLRKVNVQFNLLPGPTMVGSSS